MSKQTYLITGDQARKHIVGAVMSMPRGYVVEIKKKTRSLEQNAKMWAVLQEFSDRLSMVVNGEPTKVSADDWKTVLTASFRNETQRVAVGLDGGVIFLGMSTRAMKVDEMSEFIEFLEATAVEKIRNYGVDGDMAKIKRALGFAAQIKIKTVELSNK